MPRGWRPKPTEEERLASIASETNRIIKMYMAERGVQHDMDLAAMIGMNRGTLSAKFKSGAWTQRDLCKIISALKIRADGVAKMMGVSA